MVSYLLSLPELCSAHHMQINQGEGLLPSPQLL